MGTQFEVIYSSYIVMNRLERNDWPGKDRELEPFIEGVSKKVHGNDIIDMSSLSCQSEHMEAEKGSSLLAAAICRTPARQCNALLQIVFFDFSIKGCTRNPKFFGGRRHIEVHLF